MGLTVASARLAYVSESYDPSACAHVVNVSFVVNAEGEPRLAARDAHVVGLAWVARASLAQYVRVGVVRDPLCAFLSGDERRYRGFRDAGITIEFADPP